MNCRYYLNLIFILLLVKSAQSDCERKEDEWYCKIGSDARICRQSEDLDDPCEIQQDECFCDSIEIKNETGIYIGGPNCESEDGYGESFCYVGNNSPCDDKELNSYASSKENLWWRGAIHISQKACANMAMEMKTAPDTGNEPILNGTKITLDFSSINGTIDLSGPVYDEPKHEICKEECKDRNDRREDGYVVCSAWSFDTRSSMCYFHTNNACCGQREKQELDEFFISGYDCPVCWSTYNDCPCTKWELAGSGTNSGHATIGGGIPPGQA